MMISSRFTRWLTLVALAATVAVALLLAPIRPLPPAGSNVVGENRFHVVENDGGSLEAIAKNITSGSGAVAGQPGRRSVRARAGSVLTIPLQTILPDAPRQGIVINLAELRLYYYPPGKNEVTVYPIGIGQLGAIRSHLPWSPPSLISALIPRTPTANIRARYKAQGIDLPAVVPAGPDNPMGHHAIRGGIWWGLSSARNECGFRDRDARQLRLHSPAR